MLKLYLFILFIIPNVWAKGPCDATNCKDCSIIAGCGWCVASQKCLPGDVNGPNEDSPDKCYGAAWEFQMCTDCSVLKTCGSCLEYNADCYWCAGGGTHPNECVSWDTPSFCTNKRVNSCPCETYGSCNDCTVRSRGDCLWCTDSKKCVAQNQTNGCLAAHTCPCESNKECSTCIEDDGCAWCKVEAKCAKTSDPGCTMIAHTCPDKICQDHLSCDDCHKEDGCKWCSDLGGCKPNNADYSCVTPLSCSTYCENFKTCDICNEMKGCNWCSNTQSCTNLANPKCTKSHTCPGLKPLVRTVKKKGFDGGSFVGGMFLVIGLIGLSVFGYLIYRWKFSERSSYQELRVNNS